MRVGDREGLMTRREHTARVAVIKQHFRAKAFEREATKFVMGYSTGLMSGLVLSALSIYLMYTAG